MVTSHLENTDASRKDLQNVKAKTKGTIRVEVRITEPKAVRRYTDKVNISDKLIELWENRHHIFLDTFARVIPFGDFYKKDKAVDIVRSEVADSTMRRKMLQLIELIPNKKSLWLAQKAVNCRDVDKIMRAFAKIELSPVTVGKRQNVKHLKSLYKFRDCPSNCVNPKLVHITPNELYQIR